MRNISSLWRRVAIGVIVLASSMSNGSENAAAASDNVTSNVTTGAVASSATNYNPADVGLYGAYPPMHPLLSLVLFGMTGWGNIFLCAVGIIDIVWILLYAPTAIYSVEHGEFPGEWWCMAQGFFIPFLGTLSACLQTGMWVCRYIQLAFPLQYPSMLTNRRTAIGIVTCILVALTPPLVQVARLGAVRLWIADVVSADITAPVSLMVPCAMGGPEMWASLCLTVCAVFTSCFLCGLVNKVVKDVVDNNAELTGVVNDQFQHKRKAAKTFTIIFVLQLVTWLPAGAVGILTWAGILSLFSRVVAIIADIFHVFMMTSTFSDSIILHLRKRVYSRAVRKMYEQIMKRFRPDVEISNRLPQDIPMRTMRTENS
ncbi:PREDICTED: trace amine-associated receptor 13c-like [Branchiostoma belcheri]|uniref:Trace amine-associated receptor 13c-like n=1 Tax=Branchiostoma belcheri TaxID=7741 RepID=A0A6P4Z2P5_BRABE|nr:PREDICTED: trace amine-associated receptor 13c-like [Branchiostoma belcheri]